jgi:hypothetical protein
LKKYIFSGVPRAAAKATRVAKYLTSKVQFQSHARRIGIDDLQSRGVKILDLRTNSTLQNAVWELNIVINLTFGMTAAYKIFENNNNEALIRQLQILAPSQGNPTP